MGRDLSQMAELPVCLLFQSTRPHGARPVESPGSTCSPKFQSTRPHGARQVGIGRAALNCMFQSTRPHGARLNKLVGQKTLSEFQSTRPHGARPLFQTACTFNYKFQSTRPHGARLGGVTRIFLFAKVSIHAPAWGATNAVRTQQQQHDVSIHAPAWGATAAGIPLVHFLDLFQSTRPHGARLIMPFAALADSVFQSTRPHGARQMRFGLNSNNTMFQSTRPHGARRGVVVETLAKSSFNPRARMGRDI